MTSPFPAWRKSSRSDTSGNDCVELARLPRVIGVRDSKNPAAGNLFLTGAQFATLLADIKAGKLSL
jgi:Domain of unknown function (DUF397)